MSQSNESDYALLSAAAYRTSRNEANWLGTPAGSGWDLLRADRGGDGFEYSVFKRGNEFVIAYTGTDEWQDWLTNIPAYLGVITSQLDQAAAVYARIVKENGSAHVTFTGHSLGGGLASLMGVFFDRPAITFDQAPFLNAAR